MAKAPVPGQVKTRLCPPLSPEQAAELAACMAQDTVANAQRVTADALIAYAPEDGSATLGPMLLAGLLWTLQRGADLGERMQAAMEDAACLGYSPLVLIGTDSPTMPHARLTKAILLLCSRQADMAICPTEDGGFSLIGLREPVPGLFADVAWSTPTALADTARSADRLGLRIARLPEGYDIDTPEDLERLRAELRSDREARLRAPHTCRWLEENATFDNRPYA